MWVILCAYPLLAPNNVDTAEATIITARSCAFLPHSRESTLHDKQRRKITSGLFRGGKKSASDHPITLHDRPWWGGRGAGRAWGAWCYRLGGRWRATEKEVWREGMSFSCPMLQGGYIQVDAILDRLYW